MFKVVVIKAVCKKPSLDPSVLTVGQPPIFILLLKIRERVVVKQLSDHPQMKIVYLKRWSHVSELIITNYLFMASDSGLIFLLLLLDFSAVFNTIDHNMLLQRLEHAIDTEITTLEWFESYLSNRLQSNSKSF